MRYIMEIATVRIAYLAMTGFLRISAVKESLYRRELWLKEQTLTVS